MPTNILEHDQAQADALDIIYSLSDGGEHRLDACLDAERLARARLLMSDWGCALLEPVPGIGRLGRGPLELLSAREIGQRLPPVLRGRLRVRVIPVLESTNRWLMEQALKPGAPALACLAEYQTGGRGRRGRHWVMPFASGVALSLCWDASAWGDVPPWITLALGVSVARALRDTGVPDIGLKWPNDLFVAGRKLGGMLVEQRRMEGRVWLVIGLGINVRMPDDASIDQSWTDLATELQGVVPSRNAVAARVLGALAQVLAAFPDYDAAQLMTAWPSYDVLSGERVRAREHSGEIEGVACGIDELGRLRIADGSREWLVDTGDVSIRRVSA